MSGSIKILASEFTQDQPLQLAPGIKAGFPSPATDYLRDPILSEMRMQFITFVNQNKSQYSIQLSFLI